MTIRAGVERLARPAMPVDAGEREVRSLGLNVQLRVDATRRRYEDDDEARLLELFGPRAVNSTLQSLGLAGTVSGGAIMAYLFVLKVMGYEIVIEHGPLMIAGALLLLAGLMMFSTGLIGEMMMRTYFESQDRRIYAVREILTRKQRGVAGGTKNP